MLGCWDVVCDHLMHTSLFEGGVYVKGRRHTTHSRRNLYKYPMDELRKWPNFSSLIAPLLEVLLMYGRIEIGKYLVF